MRRAPPAELPPLGVIGIGLVGGSLGKALRAAAPGLHLVGVDTSRTTRRAAVADGSFDEVTARCDERLLGCGLIVLCVPFGALPRVLAELGPHLSRAAVLSDAVGIKAPVREVVHSALPAARYVGAHPMAGGEHGGYGASRADLFSTRTVVVCPERADAAASRLVERMWRATGAVTVRLRPEQHDRIVAATSHLPYLAALSLVRVAKRVEGHAHIAGRGFADATRRADFAPEVMAAVVGHNRHVPATLRALASELTRLATRIEASPDALLVEAARARRVRRALEGSEQRRR